MTVKALKAILKNAKDDADIYVDDGTSLYWNLQISVDSDGDVSIEVDEVD